MYKYIVANLYGFYCKCTVIQMNSMIVLFCALKKGHERLWQNISSKDQEKKFKFSPKGRE